jgi:hypothetical protein
MRMRADTEAANGTHSLPVVDGNALSERNRKALYVFMGLLVLYVVVRGLAGAATRPFSFEEIVTLAVNGQPSLKAVWAALASAVDAQPMGFYLFERAGTALVQNPHFGLRLPAILAFPCTLICVFLYIKKRSGELIGCLCAVLLLSTMLFSRYAIEGRPYSLLMACIAFALVCYQHLPSAFWTVMLGLSLALAESIHPYAVFAMAPFGLAEAVVFLITRRFRWSVWLALAMGTVPLVGFWPLLANVRAVYGGYLKNDYSFRGIPATYGAYFLTDSGYGVAFAAVCIAAVIALRLWPQHTGTAVSVSRNEEQSEGILLAGFVCLPLITYSVVRVMHGGMRDAYAMAAILGMCLAVGCMLTLVKRVGLVLFAVFLAFNVGLREFKFWESAHSLHLVKPTESLAAFVRSTGYENSDLPIVIASGMTYPQLAYYATGSIAHRLVYLTDNEKAIHYQGGDSIDKSVELLGKYMHLQARDYTEFTSAHPVFLVFGGEPGYANTWLAQHLSRQDYSVKAVAVDPTRRLFLVDMRSKISAQEAPSKP